MVKWTKLMAGAMAASEDKASKVFQDRPWLRKVFDDLESLPRTSEYGKATSAPEA